MSKKITLASLFLLGLTLVTACATTTPFANSPKTLASPYDIVKTAPAEHWRSLDADNTLYMQLQHGLVIIELAPSFAPTHVNNIKALAREKFYDGLSIYRVVEGFVAQGGDQSNEKPITTAARTIGPERFTKQLDNSLFTPLGAADGYAAHVGYVNGMPAAMNAKKDQAWLVHCPAAFAMAREESPNSGGTEFYVVLGHSPRYLDRNVAVFGRVVHGMDVMQKLNRPSSTPDADPMGVLKQEQVNPIISLRVAADLPANEQLNIEVMKTDSESFQQMIASRRNRPEPWFIEKHDFIDVCGVAIPIRVKP